MKKNNTALVVLEGALAGVALGVAATLFLKSKKGEALKSDLKDSMGDFYKKVSPKLKKIGKMTKEEYTAFMGNAAKKYAKAKKLSEQVSADLIKDASQSWKHFTGHATK